LLDNFQAVIHRMEVLVVVFKLDDDIFEETLLHGLPVSLILRIIALLTMQYNGRIIATLNPTRGFSQPGISTYFDRLHTLTCCYAD